MRLLAVFIAVCALMLAALAWHLIAPAQPEVTADQPPLPARSAGNRADLPLTELRPVKGLPDNQPIEATTNVHGSKLTDPSPASDGRVRPPHYCGGSDPGPTSQPTVRWASGSPAGDLRRRLENARATLRDDPHHPTALRDQFEAFTGLGLWSEAADTLARLVQLAPDDVNLRFELGTLLIQSHRWMDAIAVFKEVVVRAPEHARAWFNLAVAHQAVGHLSDARGAWDRAIELAPSPAAHARRGEVLLDLGEWSAAVADFEQVLAEEPQAADATLNLSLALRKLGRAEEARAHLRSFLDQHPLHLPALNRLAEIAWSIWQAAPPHDSSLRQEVIDCCRRSLAIDPDQPSVRALLEAAESERQ
jgi:cytochrome c-type biogenesis protein CcmH/NrfG